MEVSTLRFYGILDGSAEAGMLEKLYRSSFVVEIAASDHLKAAANVT